MNLHFSLLKLAEVFGAERVRKQFVQGEGGAHPFGSSGVDGSVPGRELAQTLATTAAAGANGIAVAHCQYGDDLVLAGSDHGRDCSGFCAGSLGVRGILDVAPGEHSSAGGAKCRADTK